MVRKEGAIDLGVEKGSREYFDRVASKWDEIRRSFFIEEVREGPTGQWNLSRAG